jgi:hypothetical protein
MKTPGSSAGPTHARGPELAFAARLFDLLSTLESSFVIGLAKSRVRGLGEQLAFACSALGASEGLAGLESTATTHLAVPVVANRTGHREIAGDLPYDGTILSHVLTGGSTYSVSLEPGDESVRAFEGWLEETPVAVLAVPIRVGDRVVGGAAFFSSTPFAQEAIEMGERLAEVLGLTAEAFFTERMLFELFARSLPDLLGTTAATSLPEKLLAHLRAMRVSDAYRQRVELAASVGKLTSRTVLEANLAGAVLRSFEAYVAALEGSAG